MFVVEFFFRASVPLCEVFFFPTGLIPETPHDMREIMKYTQEHFVNLELNSEIAVSSGSAAAAMEAGYSGIVNKLNIFMVNVLRFKGEGDLSGLVDGAR